MRVRGLAPDAHARTSLARAGMTATARKVFDDMARAEVAMNTHVCNAMLHLRLMVKDSGRAEALMTRMDAAGVPLDRLDGERGRLRRTLSPAHHDPRDV
jgi:pentatricopeptide repeat protein